MALNISELINEKRPEQFTLYNQHLNHQLLHVLKTLGFDKKYVRAENQYLYDEEGNRYLDLLSGYGVYPFGRNHPNVIQALKQTLDLQLANMVQFDAPLLAACCAEKLAKFLPAHLNKFFFCNSGTEAVEGAIKFAKAATRREKLLSCESGFHGLTTGSLAINGSEVFKKDFYPLLASQQVPFNDLAALETALKTKQFACFVLEPIQGKTVLIPSNDYLPQVSRLCQKYGTLLIIDEVQTGMGRTGQFLASQHWPKTEADIITLSKALSGGFIPVGVIAMRPEIFAKTYKNMEHAVVHSCTFGRNDLAMAAALAALDLVEEQDLLTQATDNGAKLLSKLQEKLSPFEMVKEVRGKGMMIGIEFCPPKSLMLKTGWALLEAASKGLFCQLIVIPLFRDFRMLTQVAGPNVHIVKLIPPITLSEQDIEDTADAFAQVVAQAHRFPGAIWDLGKTLAVHSIKK
ncbi:MAG: aspartate aminotransferase family protein [Proteobacteria bacterium]|nr:aspartate aminotransferase family protein [Pseudomonadota bacterium]